MLRRKSFWFATFFLVLFMLYLSMSLPVKRQLCWIDARTISVKTQMLWFGQWESEPVIKPSALEKWAREHDQFEGYNWYETWRPALSVWGIPTESRRSVTRPMFDGMQGKLTELLVEKATDEQLTSYMHTMNHGTDDEREKAYQQVFYIIFPESESTHNQ